MNRRKFLGILCCLPVAAKVVKEVPWLHKPSPVERHSIWQLQQLMNDHMNLQQQVLDSRLYGIPYHQTDASTGSWLGFSREGPNNVSLAASSIKSPLRTVQG